MRNFFYKWTGLWRTLAVVFALVMAFGFTVGALLEANSSQVNRVLHTTTSTVSGGDYSSYPPDDAYVTKDEDGNIVSGDTQALVDAHIDLGTQVGAEGSVLLKNDNDTALPLSGSEKITLFGYGSSPSGAKYGMSTGGSVDLSQCVSLYDALTDRGFDVNSAMNDYYESQYNSNYNYLKASLSDISTKSSSDYYITNFGYKNYKEVQPDTDKMNGYTDVGIVVVSRASSEGSDFYPGSINLDSSKGRTILALTTDELTLIHTAKQLCNKVVVLVNANNPMELGEITTGSYKNDVDAILWVGFPGCYGYYGVADVIAGNTNSSGHLADTYAYNSTSAPAMQNFSVYQYTNTGSFSSKVDSDDRYKFYLVEAESIYIGYKYYETRYEDSVLGQGYATSSDGAFDSKSAGSSSTLSWDTDGSTNWNYDEEVAYSFGYGKSYTSFTQEIKGFTINAEDGYRTATVTVEVTNTGDRAGKSVVQVYGQAPYTAGGVEKASVQLLNYEKTDEIAAKGTATVSMDINLELLASYDNTIVNDDGTTGSYVMDPSTEYYIALGCNSTEDGAHAAVNNILEMKATTAQKANMDETGDTGAVWKFEWKDSYGNPFSQSENGTQISNQLDDADLNYWEDGTVSYLSRSDWRWPDADGNTQWDTDLWSLSHWKGYTDIAANDDMIYQLGNDTYQVSTTDDVSGILFDQENGITFADMFDENGKALDYEDEKWDDLLDELDLQEAIEFVINGNKEYLPLDSIGFLGGTFNENGPTGLQQKMPSVYEAPWFNADDENLSYSWNDMGGATLQASTFNQELLEEVGVLWGNDSLFTNCPMLWAPALNIHRTPYNGRSAEYYSEDAALTGYSAASVSQGAESKGFIVTIKHFAFNDEESNRCGLSVYLTEQQARENELRGFQIAIEGGVKAVMSSFNRVGCTFSSAHKGLISGILRGEWGFKGYLVTDLLYSYKYVNFAESVSVGTSTFDTTYDTVKDTWGDSATLAATYAKDATMLQAIKDAVHSTLWTFANSNIANYTTSDASSVWVMNWWRAAYISLEVVGGVVAGLAVILYIVSLVLGKKDDKDSGQDSENGLEVQQ